MSDKVPGQRGVMVYRGKNGIWLNMHGTNKRGRGSSATLFIVLKIACLFFKRVMNTCPSFQSVFGSKN